MSFIHDTLRDRHRKETIRTVMNIVQVMLTLCILAIQLYSLATR